MIPARWGWQRGTKVGTEGHAATHPILKNRSYLSFFHPTFHPQEYDLSCAYKLVWGSILLWYPAIVYVRKLQSKKVTYVTIQSDAVLSILIANLRCDFIPKITEHQKNCSRFSAKEKNDQRTAKSHITLSSKFKHPLLPIYGYTPPLKEWRLRHWKKSTGGFGWRGGEERHYSDGSMDFDGMISVRLYIPSLHRLRVSAASQGINHLNRN